jgi:adenylyltransferase/sulfurtransferase
LHRDEDIGKREIDSALEKLGRQNQSVKIDAMEETITEANVSQLVAGFDLIVDAIDNLAMRYILNKVALKRNIPFFTGQSMALEVGL